MNKHRVVGFIVIVALIVIATEFLLNYRLQTKVATVELVQPPMPELVENTDSVEVEDIQPAIQLSTEADQAAEATSGSSTDVGEQSISASIHQPKSNSATPGVHAWVVQLASYADQENADKLVGRLRKNGFDAFSYSAVLNGKNYFRVNAGPVATTEAAKELMVNLEKKVKLKGYLVKYSPVDELKNSSS